MNLSSLLWLIGGLLVISVILDWVSFFGFAWGIPSACRAIYHKVHGHIVVQTPEDLSVAFANGLIRTGDVLIVRASHEGEDGHVSRYAIHPSVVGRSVGTKLRVVSISSKRLALRESDQSSHS